MDIPFFSLYLPIKHKSTLFMNKLLLILISILLMTGCANKKGSTDTCQTYAEANNPETVKSDWNAVEKGMHVSVGSIDRKYERDEIPEVNNSKEWTGAAWKGERVSMQFVIWTKDSVPNVKVEFDDFVSPNGDKIATQNAYARFVRYVLTDEFAGGCGHRKPEDFASSLSADALDNISCFSVSPNSTRPVWVTIDVPADAAVGTYSSNLQVFANGKKKETISLKLEVLPKTLPPAADWEFHLDLWQNPYATARIAGVEPWSEQHWAALKPVMELLANAGQKVITATLNKDPWNGQTEDPYGSMIEWTKKTDGTWNYNYTVFDNWVQFMMDLGIKDQINCYSMVPWGNFVYYLDEKTGQEVKVGAAPGTKEYADLWKPFLKDFVKHLEEKGWKDITHIAMDERAPAEMKAMLKLLEETSPGMGVALADNHKSYKLYPDQLKDLCVARGAVVDEADRLYRKEKGYVTTWYVCCGDEFPNTFTFSDPAEAAFIGWYTRAAGFDGFLRWAYDSWVKDPFVDSRFRTWPAGDTYVVYPEGRSSIRFERLREGIQDAEKIRLLREQFMIDSSEAGRQKLVKLNQMVDQFNFVERTENYNDLLNQGKDLLIELSR
jgi:hypothetical protein